MKNLLSQWIPFKEALDFRLLDMATSGDGLLTVAEYEHWQKTVSLVHVRKVRVVNDAVAAAYQDTVRTSNHDDYNEARSRLGLDPLP